MKKNKKNNFIRCIQMVIFLGVVSLNFSAWSGTQKSLKIITKDYEVKSLDMAFRADGVPSRVRFKTCDKCDKVDLKISPEAKYLKKGERVPLNQLRDLNGRSGAVIFNKESELVVKIIFFER